VDFSWHKIIDNLLKLLDAERIFDIVGCVDDRQRGLAPT
jgi:hypothetical protein